MIAENLELQEIQKLQSPIPRQCIEKTQSEYSRYLDEYWELEEKRTDYLIEQKINDFNKKKAENIKQFYFDFEGNNCNDIKHFYFDFEGNNCNDIMNADDNRFPCLGWNGKSKSCECGNRRVYWEYDSDRDIIIAKAD